IILYLIFRMKPEGLVSSPDEIEWGVSFSKEFAEHMGLDWKNLYLSILDDLKAKTIRIPLYWTEIEPYEKQYFFDDYDWMIEEARQRSVRLVLVVGRKVPRWPECHIPDWVSSYEKEYQQEKTLAYIEQSVNRYKTIDNIYAWQVENEPFLSFGICPARDVELLDKEIALVHKLDPVHPIIVTDSGELSTWVRAANRADIFGSTLYRIIYKKPLGYIKYPLDPKFFWAKANFVHLFDPTKPIIISELQAEPWAKGLVHTISLEEQSKSMDLKKFQENIEYAKEVGFSQVYLWGVEWWYWLKEKHEKPEIWEAAKAVIQK
ncbi:MAG: cellulase family glycosylhydrolase, partial [bacterium]